MENLNNIMENLNNCLNEVAKFQLQSLENRTFKIEEKKTEFDMVTEIDKKSEKMIMEFIKNNYPGHAILTEETGFHVGNKENKYEWVIDPIDGTTNFIHGFPFHCISVGLRYKGKTVLGVVNAPQLNIVFSTIKGKGAFRNSKKISVSEIDTLHKSIVVTGFPYERAIENPNLKCFNNVVNKVAGIRRTGAAALDLCFVASGNFDAYWEYNVKEWDICAGELILKEAGGTSQKFSQGHNVLFYFGNGNIDNTMLEILL
ncbi:inositol monophosphatase [Leptotrichia sp. OH3620_COT-345]|uniref:inositol monophosphatase family protein n=1 Tax=Leptotrichia sp. OH3620_COT-345 TaxID=2491048 RepID=UPI000F6455D3|nr:inositol monophosphatase family protein [Leptotrichia sp. OH3620_COT-345]RRD39000.1 inositol monophosphatase [Leptotrichia sp. OH3620_COT-345]